MTLRTKEERIKETRKIISKLNELRLTIIYEPIRELYMIMKTYIHDGTRQNFEIPFGMYDKTIQGCLEIDINKQCVVKITGGH